MIGYVTKQRYEEELRRIKVRNASIIRKQRLKEAKYNPGKKLETSKLLAIYLFVLLNLIVLYSMVSMWTFADLSYLGVLISDLGAQILVYAIYCLKAYHGKKQEELMKYHRENAEYNAESESEDTSEE